jgi:deoxyribonuclease V
MTPADRNIDELLRTDISLHEAELLQAYWRDQLANKTYSTDGFLLDSNDVSTVAGVDVAYPPDPDPEWGVACAVLWDIGRKTEINRACSIGDVHFPYYPGFLGFREAKIMFEAVQALKRRPDLVMCDGHGYAHPRRFGEAVHLGIVLDLPSLGVAKQPFFGTSAWKDLDRKKSERAGVYDDEHVFSRENTGELIGYALCLTDGTKPVFVSHGYRISLECACDIALKTTLGHRQPEPLFLADKYARMEIRSQHMNET